MAIRKAFVMQLKAGCENEYHRRHNPLRTEVAEMLREHGVSSYSIYLLPQTGQLFAYVEVEDETRWAAIADTEVCRRWWHEMRDVVEMDANDRPVAAELPETFHFSQVPH